ncbi:MAG: ABC transporter permease [Erysipelotrichaceae bacterium]|nr:ABC transporter permease [Erysipelotrichaceae bacterium]
MRKYILKRLGSGALVVLFSVLFNFVIIRLAPGDPTRLLAGKDNPSPETIAALRERFGLDKPLLEQFWIYFKQLLHGDFGYSYVSSLTVWELIRSRIVPTLLIAFTGAFLGLLIGTALGIIAARKKGSKFDMFMCSISYFFDSTPSFWLGLMMILLFASILKWFPTYGMYNVRQNYTGMAHVLDVAYHMVLPVTTLVLIDIPYYFRIARSSILQTMSEDFIMTLRATGMSEQKIFFKYVMRNAIIPTVTVFGITLAYMITGVAMIEIVFAWPGMGRLMLDSITKRDYPTLSAIYLLLSISVAVMTIVVDVVYAWIDPRIRIE